MGFRAREGATLGFLLCYPLFLGLGGGGTGPPVGTSSDLMACLSSMKGSQLSPAWLSLLSLSPGPLPTNPDASSSGSSNVIYSDGCQSKPCCLNLEGPVLPQLWPEGRVEEGPSQGPFPVILLHGVGDAPDLEVELAVGTWLPGEGVRNGRAGEGTLHSELDQAPVLPI